MDEQRTTRSMHIFEDAIERAPAERGAYIAQACGGDAGLRAEVESLLSAAEQAGGFLAGPSGSGPSPALGNGNGYADAAFELGLPASDVEAALAKGSAEV